MKCYQNQTGRVIIEGYTSEGAGVARLDGCAVFVPGAARGDDCDVRVVNTRSRYAWGRIERLYTPSPYRVEPDCRAFPACGGCALRHLSYEEELWFKKNHAIETIRRIGGVEPRFDGIIGADETESYRNKAQYPVRYQKGRTVAGFYRSGTHEVVPCGDCRIESAASRVIVHTVLDYMHRYRVYAYDEASGRGVVRHVYVRTSRSGAALVCIVATRRELPAARELTAMLRRAYPGVAGVLLNVNTRRDNVILSGETVTLWGADSITETLLGYRFQLSVDSFFQVNPAQTEKLYAVAAAYLGDGVDELLDLYCGVGSIGICLSEKARRLTGVEIVEQAVRDAEENARANGLANARFLAADAGTAAARLAEEGYRPDAIVVDPPRKGLDAACIDAVAQMAPEKLIYISCNPSTQARDVALLAARGYEAIRMTAVDLFPRTYHVETVVLLSKGEIDSKKVRVEFDLEDVDMSGFQKGATYEEIKAYVLDKFGLKVSSLYISQIKRRCGIEVGQNYNLSKKEDAKVPQCPPEKETAIMEALKHFRMI